MTFYYKNVYLNETALITGPYEKKGPLVHYFDKSYDDFYFGAKTWEQAESKIIEESVDLLLLKANKIKSDIDLHFGSDLLNQLVANNYAASSMKIPYIGIYSACASSVGELILASNMIENKQIKRCICTSSSHNNGAEKQYRYPVEYGGPKRKTTTFTVTGAACALLSSEKSNIRVESGTIGIVQDLGVTDVYHMGAAMAPAAADTLYRHLKDTKRDISYYDYILTGDLGKYGKEILKEYMKMEYNIELKNYDDAACMIYADTKEAYAGGSGVACLPLVGYGYILSKMKKKNFKRVLFIATGALMNPSMTNQKLSIPSIAHLISLEVTE